MDTPPSLYYFPYFPSSPPIAHHISMPGRFTSRLHFPRQRNMGTERWGARHAIKNSPLSPVAFPEPRIASSVRGDVGERGDRRKERSDEWCGGFLLSFLFYYVYTRFNDYTIFRCLTLRSIYA